MIDDKMAKMAVNTLTAYCDGKKCADCAVSPYRFLKAFSRKCYRED